MIIMCVACNLQSCLEFLLDFLLDHSDRVSMQKLHAANLRVISLHDILVNGPSLIYILISDAA
jgi:hypothetical protein